MCDNFILSDPSSFKEFLNMKNFTSKKLSYLNKVLDKEDHTRQVDFNGELLSYSDMKYSDFDNYLVNREHLNADAPL